MALVRTTVLAALFLASVPAAAQTAPGAKGGNPAKGKVLFLQCAACHSTKAGDPHKVGPNLAGVAGAKAGSRPGYKYSKVFSEAKFAWDDARLANFVAKPGAVMPGTKMVFGGVADPVKRADIVAYMKTLR